MWIISILALGAMLTSIFTGIIIHHLGAKGGQFIFVFPIALGWISTVFARTEVMIYAGRFFAGLSCGAYSIIIPIYINEIADKELRGRLLAWCPFMQNVGIFFAYGLGLVVEMFVMDLICASVILGYGVLLYYLPESPLHLVRDLECFTNRIQLKPVHLQVKKEETTRAIQAMRKLYGTSYDCVTEVARLVHANTPQNFEDALVSEWKLLFDNHSNRRALYIVVGLSFFLHMSGIYPLIFTLSNIFDSCQTKIDSNAVALIIAVTMILSSFTCVATIDFVGRRKLLLVSTAGMIVMGCFMVAHLYFEFCCADYMDEFKDLSILFTSLYVGFFSVGLGPVTLVMMAELFTTEVAHLAMSINIMVNYILMFGITMLFYPILQAVALVGVFALFTLVSVLAFVFVIFTVPETNGKTHQEIEKMLSACPVDERDTRTRKCCLPEVTTKGVDIKTYFQ